MLLDELPNGVQAKVIGLAAATMVQGPAVGEDTLQRLSELGFIAGEPVEMVRRGPGGREPLAVLIGNTLVALRLLEARCIQVSARDESEHGTRRSENP